MSKNKKQLTAADLASVSGAKATVETPSEGVEINNVKDKSSSKYPSPKSPTIEKILKPITGVGGYHY